MDLEAANAIDHLACMSQQAFLDAVRRFSAISFCGSGIFLMPDEESHRITADAMTGAPPQPHQSRAWLRFKCMNSNAFKHVSGASLAGGTFLVGLIFKGIHRPFARPIWDKVRQSIP